MRQSKNPFQVILHGFTSILATFLVPRAKDAGLTEEGDDTLAQAIGTLKKIQAAQQRLWDAATSRDVTALNGALQEAQEIGLPDKDLREAQQTLENEERKQAARKACSSVCCHCLRRDQPPSSCFSECRTGKFTGKCGSWLRFAWTLWRAR